MATLTKDDLAPGGSAARLASRRPFAVVPRNAIQRTVRMRDGVRLATDVYLPDSTGPWPSLLCRLPYDKAGEECFLPLIAEWFTARDYSVVVQDCRGKVRSDGVPVPYRTEAIDGFDTIAWIAEQPWSTGRVGMLGDSYYGFTQWAAASLDPPALAAIVPRAAPFNYRAARYRQGVLALEAVASYSLETWVDEALYDWAGSLDWSIRPLSEIVPNALGGRRPLGLDQWAKGRFPAASRVKPSGRHATLHMGGFWDPVHRQTVESWKIANATKSRQVQRLYLDTRDHGWTPLRPENAAYVDPFASTTRTSDFVDDYLSPLLEFFDEHVAHRATGAATPVRWRFSDLSWGEGESWPPPQARRKHLYLSIGGSLVEVPDAAERSIGWEHDPTNPVPSLEHPFYTLIDPPTSSVKRPDVLVFAGEPSQGDITDLVGPVTFTVELASSSESTHLYARLWDMGPQSDRRIVEGGMHISGPWPRKVSVDLGHAAYRLEPGHALRLELASSCYPLYAIHPGTSDDPWTAERFVSSGNQISIGGLRAAKLAVTVLDGGT